MLELDTQPHPELIEVALQRLEVYPQFSRDRLRLFAGERFLDSQISCPLRSQPRMVNLTDGTS
jgi:hypothetical protein